MNQFLSASSPDTPYKVRFRLLLRMDDNNKFDKEWRRREENIELSRYIADKLGIPLLPARILVARGMGSAEEIYGFLNPKLRSLHDPFMFNDMERAVRRIERSLKDGGKVLVHGDYDADGISSTALMYRSLSSSFGPERVNTFLPSRYGEGYGISIEKMEEAKQQGFDLVISVDCGIKAVDAARRSKELGLDLIITDHHEPGKVLPEPFVLIDPKVNGSGYPFKELAGVGVAFKLAQALHQREVIPTDPRELLDLVALGTVADLVPLKEENRTLVKYGIEKLRNTSSLGLKVLMSECGIDPISGPTSMDIAFKLGPRINSAGRMGDPSMALELLLTEDRVDADLFSRQLNNLNFKRRAVGKNLVEEVFKLITEAGRDEDDLIIAAGRDWNPGVLGVTANKVMERYFRPVAVLSVGDDGMAKGSARAPEGFDLIKALDSVSDLLMEYGGHERAAGLTLRWDDLEEVRLALLDMMKEEYPAMVFTPVVDVDIDVGPNELSMDHVASLDIIEPFGTDNPPPLVELRDAVIEGSVTTVGDGKHLKFFIGTDGIPIECIFFNNGHLAEGLYPGSVISLVGEPSVHTWGGRSRVQLRIEDIHPE